jgi:hypothetical protein
MTTITCIDYRRTDERKYILDTPQWITSGLMLGSACEDKGALLFSFPEVGEITFVHMIVFQVVAAFTSSTLIDVGTGTLATDAVTTGGDITIVDLDEYIKQGDITVGTIGRYGSTTSNTSDWLAAMIVGSYVAPFIITGAATTVPCVYCTMSNTGTIAAGTARFHMLISKCPS